MLASPHTDTTPAHDGFRLVLKSATAAEAVVAPAVPVTQDEQQVVFGVVYMPDVVDTQGDFMSAVEIRKAAYEFMSRGDTKAVDLMHNNKRTGAHIVETFLTRKGDPDFPIEGSWVAAVHVPDKALWARIKKGEINGFSLEALAKVKQHDKPLTGGILMSGAAIGRTMKSDSTTDDDHVHSFEVEYDANGKFKGGRTNVVKGADGLEHWHEIKRGVVTEESSGHKHRFSTIEHFLQREAAA